MDWIGQLIKEALAELFRSTNELSEQKNQKKEK